MGKTTELFMRLDLNHAQIDRHIYSQASIEKFGPTFLFNLHNPKNSSFGGKHEELKLNCKMNLELCSGLDVSGGDDSHSCCPQSHLLWKIPKVDFWSSRARGTWVIWGMLMWETVKMKLLNHNGKTERRNSRKTNRKYLRGNKDDMRNVWSEK